MEQIVVGFDGSQQANEALRWAMAEATFRGHSVLVVESWHEPFFAGPSIIEAWEDPNIGERQAKAELEAAVAAVSDDFPEVEVATKLVSQRPVLALTAASQQASMIVVGGRGRGGFASLLLGSVSRHLASTAASTVVVVRNQGEPQGDVVVGIDGSEPSRRALAWAAEAARHRQCRLRVVMAWSYLKPLDENGAEPFRADYGEADAASAVEEIIEDVLGPEPEVELLVEAVCDLVPRALIERADEAALLVVGPRGWSRHVHVDLGSVTLQLLHHAPCPLALVRVAEGQIA